MTRVEREQAASSQRFSEFFCLARDFLDRAAEYDAHGHYPDALTHYRKGDYISNAVVVFVCRFARAIKHNYAHSTLPLLLS